MTDDLHASTSGKQISNPVFYGVLALSVGLIVAAGIYLLGGGWKTSAAHLPSASTFNQSQAPSSPVAQPGGPTRAGAVAVVEKSFRLAAAGKFAASCALESPAYLSSDAQHYAHGSCAAQLRADATTLISHGRSMRLTSAKVVSYADGRATILVEVAVGGRVATEHVYVRHHADRWWITGGDDSGGDLGF